MSTALDVAISLIFMYLLLALLVTTLQELAASLFALRAKGLYRAIEGMLKGETGSNLLQSVYEHPLIGNLAEKKLTLVGEQLATFGDGLPSYIPSKTFALALLDVLQGQALSKVSKAESVLAQTKQLIDHIEQPHLQKTFKILFADAERLEQDVDKRADAFVKAVEGWFNDRMARASGWYKRSSQLISLGLALVLSVACNASTFKVFDRLWHDANLRAAVVSSAQAYHDGAAANLVASHLPIGWHGYTAEGWDLLVIPLGWLVTALAVSLGAGFWFDLLGRALQLRGTGTRVSPTSGRVESKA